jgi:hypothetical protein
MGLEANGMRFCGTRGFQLGLFGMEDDRMRSDGSGGKRMNFYGTRGFQLGLFGT